MSRASVINPYQKIWDETGLEVVASGTVTFYQNMTTDLADIFEDADLTIAQDNPYTLDESGTILGDIHFNGTLSMMVSDSTGAELYTIDNVTCFDPASAFSAWDEFTVYSEGGSNIVTGPDGNYYVSLVDDNVGNTPASSPSDWQVINFFQGSAAELARIDAIAALAAANQALIIGNGTTWTATTLAAVTPNYLAGLGLTNNASDSEHDIDIAAGRCNNSTNTLSILLSSGITKRIDATWAAGTGNGGLASGASLSNDTWYHVFAVISGGASDAMFDSSVTCANGVANNAVTSFRRLGSVLTDGSANIIGFLQSGDEFTWNVIVNNVSTSNPGTSAVTPTLSVPLGVSTIAKFVVSLVSADAVNTTYLLCTATAQTDTAPGAAGFQIRAFAQTVDTNAFGSLFFVQANTSSQIRYRVANAGGTTDVTVVINTIGWIDRRGR